MCRFKSPRGEGLPHLGSTPSPGWPTSWTALCPPSSSLPSPHPEPPLHQLNSAGAGTVNSWLLPALQDHRRCLCRLCDSSAGVKVPYGSNFPAGPLSTSAALPKPAPSEIRQNDCQWSAACVMGSHSVPAEVTSTVTSSPSVDRGNKLQPATGPGASYRTFSKAWGFFRKHAKVQINQYNRVLSGQNI